MKHIKIILTTIFIGLVSVSAMADASYLTIYLKSKKAESFLLKEKPTITYAEGAMVIDGQISTSYAIDEIEEFKFTEGSVTEIQTVKNDGILFSYLDNKIVVVSGLNENESVCLFGINGAVLRNYKVDGSGNLIIVLPQNNGVYILKLRDKSFKCLKK